MRFAVALTSLALLAACATSAPATPSAPSAPAVAPANPSSRIARWFESAGRQGAPTQAEIVRALGAADIARQDGAGAALTYRLDTCALLLVFTADGQNAMRLAEAHPSARRPGAAAPSLDQCAAEAEARRR